MKIAESVNPLKKTFFFPFSHFCFFTGLWWHWCDFFRAPNMISVPCRHSSHTLLTPEKGSSFIQKKKADKNVTSFDRHFSLPSSFFCSSQWLLTRVTAVLYGPLISFHSNRLRFFFFCAGLSSAPLHAHRQKMASVRGEHILLRIALPSISVICTSNLRCLSPLEGKSKDSIGHRRWGYYDAKPLFRTNIDHFTQLLICMGWMSSSCVQDSRI